MASCVIILAPKLEYQKITQILDKPETKTKQKTKNKKKIQYGKTLERQTNDN